ncbi:MAG: DUF433 domain-containing protein [Chloroflexota bacterium]
MVIEVREFKGIYIASEAAVYLNATLSRNVHITQPKYPIHSRNLIRWIRIGLSSPELTNVPGRQLIISFEDLISMRVVSILRALGVKWSKIHHAESWLREKTGYPRPFAIERVWTETSDVFAEFHEGFIAASRGGQLAFTALVEQYLISVQDMIFAQYNGGIKVADSWRPHEDVLINPRIQFGEPCVEGTRIRTRIINELLMGGDTIFYLMRSFDLSESQISHAVEWEHRLQTARLN